MKIKSKKQQEGLRLYTLCPFLTLCVLTQNAAVSNGFIIQPMQPAVSRPKLNSSVKSLSNHHPKENIINPKVGTALIRSKVFSSSRISTQLSSSLLDTTTTFLSTMTRETAEELAGPFFTFSLFPYLGFLYFLNLEENDTPKGVTVGFATLLLFVFLTVPAAITAQLQYGVSLADSDWLHGSAESLLTITNLVLVVAFRQALNGKELIMDSGDSSIGSSSGSDSMPRSAREYGPMVTLAGFMIVLAGVTALVPAALGAEVHTPYLNGFMDLPVQFSQGITGRDEPENALTVACWIIHISSLVEFLVAMGFVWRWADIVKNPTWKGLTWGLLPLHSSGITACTYHLFYNRIAVLVPLQAFLTCVGNTTAMYATYRIAISNGWEPPWKKDPTNDSPKSSSSLNGTERVVKESKENPSLIGFEDLGNALANDNDYTFLLKLFLGCAVGSYTIKYGEIFFDFPLDASLPLALGVIFVPSLLNAYKWYRRSSDATFEGWF